MSKKHAGLYNRIHELVTDQLSDGHLEQDDQELQELVTNDDEARRLYVQYMQELFHIASRLSTHSSSDDHDEAVFSPSEFIRDVDAVEEAAISSRSKAIKTSRVFFGFLAASLFLGGFFWYSMSGRLASDEHQLPVSQQVETDSGRSGAGRTEVATLVYSDGAIWDESCEPVRDLSRLAVGDELRLLEGSIQLVFDSGVEALVLAPCQLTIQDGARISSDYGRISALVGENGKGFQIDTPVARVTDLGTEFGVVVGERGQTEVAVFQGEVDLEFGIAEGGYVSTVAGKRNRLVQGEGLLIDQFGKSSRMVSIDDSRLPTVRQLPPVFHRPPIISHVQDNVVSDGESEMRSFYRIVHSGLREDSQAFVDRTHEWNGVDSKGLPDYLIGADYIMPFNDDKFASDLEVEVTINEPAVVHVFLSDDIRVPDWLSRDFIDTGENIGLDEGRNRFRKEVETATGPGESIETVFSIWKREVHRPQTILLGAVEKPEVEDDPVRGRLPGYNMYGIAAVAL